MNILWSPWATTQPLSYANKQTLAVADTRRLLVISQSFFEYFINLQILHNSTHLCCSISDKSLNVYEVIIEEGRTSSSDVDIMKMGNNGFLYF